MRGLTQVDSDSEDEQPLLRSATVSSGVIEVGDAFPRLASQSTAVDNNDDKLLSRDSAPSHSHSGPELFALSNDEPRAPVRTSSWVVLVPECGDIPQSIHDRYATNSQAAGDSKAEQDNCASAISQAPLSFAPFRRVVRGSVFPHQATLSLRIVRVPTRRVAASSTSQPGD